MFKARDISRLPPPIEKQQVNEDFSEKKPSLKHKNPLLDHLKKKEKKKFDSADWVMEKNKSKSSSTL